MADVDKDASPDEAPASEAKRGVCALCGKPRVQRYRPFCSKRCADVDLARWLGGRYAIPGAPSDEEDSFDAPSTERS